MNQGFDRLRQQEQAAAHGVPGNEGPKHTRGSSSKEQTDKAHRLRGDQHGSPALDVLWVHYYDPHYEYEPHPDVRDVRRTDKVALYDGELRFTDFHLGAAARPTCARRGLYDKTIFVTGDHGEGFGEHGIELHGYHLYPAQTKVPLIIRVPGLAPRVAPRRPATSTSCRPLLNLARHAGDPSPEIEGRSLVDVLAGGPTSTAACSSSCRTRATTSYAPPPDTRCHVIYNVSPDHQLGGVPRRRAAARRAAGDPDGEACASTKRALLAWLDQSQVPPGAAQALLPGPPTIAGAARRAFRRRSRAAGGELPASAKAAS
jgi:hypothetical protein